MISWGVCKQRKTGAVTPHKSNETQPTSFNPNWKDAFVSLIIFGSLFGKWLHNLGFLSFTFNREETKFYTVSCNFYKNNIYSLLTLLICFRGDKRTSLYTNSNKKLKDTFSLPAHFSYSQEMTNFSARVTNCERQWNSYIRNWSVIVSERIRTKERHVETMRKIPRPPPQQNSPLLSALNITANWQGPVGRPQKTKGYAFHFTLYTTLQGWYLT